jgi:hypothetical protein
MRVPVAPPAEAELELVIEDGSNPPLDLARVTAVFAELPWIYFDAPTGVVIARYGNPAAGAPAYDLEAARHTIALATVPAAGWGVPRPASPVPDAPDAAAPPVAAGAPLDVEAFEHARFVSAEGTGLFALPLDAAALAHSRGPRARFADVRLVDDQRRQVPYLLERREGPLVLDLQVEPGTAPDAGREGNGHRSTYRLSLPYENLPDARIIVETSARVFRRDVRVSVERSGDRQRRGPGLDVLAAGQWVHADQASAAPPLTLAVPATSRKDLWLTVEEGDNAALPIAAVRLLLPSYRLRFYRGAEGPLRLVYGNDSLSPPQYDLALLAPRVLGAETREARLEDPRPSPSPDTFISRRSFYILLGVAVVGLLALIARLALSREPPMV